VSGKLDITPRRGLYRPEIVRAVLSGHSILGIAFAAILYLVCLTGSLSVFAQDLERWEQPDAPVLATVSDAAVARAVAMVAPRLGAGDPLYVQLPSSDMPRLTLTTHHGEEGHNWLADAGGGIIGEARSPWTDFLTALHIQLHLPDSWGRFIVGLAGVALVSSLISGVLSHPRIVRDAFHLRLGGARRLQEADIHNRIGVWALPFHLAVSLTGALLGLSTIIVGVLALLLFRGDTGKVYALLSPPKPPVDARAAPLPDLAAILATARMRTPEATPRMLTLNELGRHDASVVITASRPGLLASQDSFVFDSFGRLISQRHPGALNVGERILGSLGPLHFGWFGGMAVRLVWGLLGIGLCVVTVSGINVWLTRRRDKGRPSPRLERVWAAIVWGQPAILATTALSTFLFPASADRLPTTAWLVLTISGIVAANLTKASASSIAVASRVAAGALLVATAFLHMCDYRLSGDSEALVVNVLMIAAAFALAGGCLSHGVGRAAVWRGSDNVTPRE
jgi:uncharacterized iron-regulated membrane protein